MIPDADCLGFDKESIQGIFQIYFTFVYQKLPLFAKIIQNFILMQKTQKWNWIGGGIFGPFFQKSALFHKKVPFLANIKRCPKFLEYALLYIAKHLSITDILTWSHWCLLSKSFRLGNNFVNLMFNTTFHCQRYLLFQARQIQ